MQAPDGYLFIYSGTQQLVGVPFGLPKEDTLKRRHTHTQIITFEWMYLRKWQACSEPQVKGVPLGLCSNQQAFILRWQLGKRRSAPLSGKRPAVG